MIDDTGRAGKAETEREARRWDKIRYHYLTTLMHMDLVRSNHTNLCSVTLGKSIG